MQLAFPNALLWLLLALPIISLYLLKLRLRRMPVSSVMLWEQVFVERKPRAIWRRLRHVISLILQLLFLGLLAAALANPRLAWQLAQARTIVLILDNSASMSATDVSPSRFAWAKRRAEKLIGEMRDGDQMAIISTARPSVDIGLTDHPRSLRRSLSQIKPTDAPARMEQAIQTARRVVAGQRNGQIILLTDRDSIDANGNGSVDLVACGTRAANLAITQFQVRRNLDDPVGFQVFAEVANFADSPASFRLEVKLNQELLDVIPVELAAEESRTLNLDYTSAAGGKLVAEIDQEDILASDNQAVAMVAPRPLQSVVLVTPGSLFLERVLASIPQLEVVVTDKVPNSVPTSTILLIHRTSIDRVPDGNVFVIDPISDSDLWQLRGPVADPMVASQDASSPLMSHVHLQNVGLPGARQIGFRRDHDSLAESLDGDPLYLASRRSNGRLLLLTADLLRSDLPLRTSFPILMSNAISWFQGGHGELQSAIAAGQTTRVLLPGALESPSISNNQIWQLTDPTGETRSIQASSETVVGPLDRCGFWVMQSTMPANASSSASPLLIACNLANRSESDVRTSPTSEQSRMDRGWAARPVWLYLTIAALVLSSTEWYLYQRRWVG